MGAKHKLKVGLVGLGALYWPHSIAGGLAGRKDATLVACATLGQSPKLIETHLGTTSERFAREHGLGLYEDPEAMVEREKPDVLALATRHSEHAKWVERLAPLGRDLYIAKTFATTERQADRIVAAGRKHKIRIAVGPSARYLPWFATVRKALAAGWVGTPFSVRIAHHHGTLDVFSPLDFYRDPREGGPELSLGWYLVDLVMHLMGRRVRGVSAVYGTYTTPSSPFLDCGKLLLSLEGGGMAAADMYFCNRFGFPGWEMELVGEKGALLVRDGGKTGYVVSLVTPRGEKVLPLVTTGPGWETFWVDDLALPGKPSVDAVWAAEVTRVCIAARRAARTGGVVKLSA